MVWYGIAHSLVFHIYIYTHAMCMPTKIELSEWLLDAVLFSYAPFDGACHCVVIDAISIIVTVQPNRWTHFDVNLNDEKKKCICVSWCCSNVRFCQTKAKQSNQTFGSSSMSWVCVHTLCYTYTMQKMWFFKFFSLFLYSFCCIVHFGMHRFVFLIHFLLISFRLE